MHELSPSTTNRVQGTEHRGDDHSYMCKSVNCTRSHNCTHTIHAVKVQHSLHGTYVTSCTQQNTWVASVREPIAAREEQVGIITSITHSTGATSILNRK